MKKLMPVIDETGGYPPMLFSLAGAQEAHQDQDSTGLAAYHARSWLAAEQSCSRPAAMKPGIVIVNFTDELTGPSRRKSNSNQSQQALLFQQATQNSRMFQEACVSPT